MSRSKQKAHDDILDLESRFLDGERLTIEDILTQYFKPKNVLDGLYAKKASMGYINNLKLRFTKIHGVWFGNINDLHQFGIPDSRAEFNYILNGYRARVMGTVRRTVQVYQDGVGKKMIDGQQQQTFLLPITAQEEKKK